MTPSPCTSTSTRTHWSPSKVFERRVDAVGRHQLPVHHHVRPRRAEVRGGSGLSVPAAAEQLHLDRDREVLVPLHRLDRLAVDHDAAVAEGPVRAVLRLLAHEAVLDREHVVREGRLVEQVAEPAPEGVVLVVGDLQDAVLHPEGVAEVHADVVAGDLRDPAVETLPVEERDPVSSVGSRRGVLAGRGESGDEERVPVAGRQRVASWPQAYRMSTRRGVEGSRGSRGVRGRA